MVTVPGIQRLALLLALLPQLLTLGLGRGVVICVAPGGHLELEASGSGCCVESTPGRADSADPVRAALVPESDSHCGLCTDFQFELDPRPNRSSGESGFVHAPDLAALPPVESGRLLATPDPTRWHGRAPDRGDPARHLIHLRSVVLRC